MPQLRSFSSFAGTPDVGASFLGGVKTVTDSYNANNQIAVEREKIAQAQAQANLEYQAQQEALQNRAMMQSQELAVQQAYQQSMLGLKERELGQEQQKNDLAAQEAAQQFQAQESMRREVEDSISKGGDVQSAFRNTLMKYGTTAHAAPAMMGDVLMNGPGGANAQLGPAELKPVINGNGMTYADTGPRSRQFFPAAKLPPTLEQGVAPGVDRIGNHYFPSAGLKDAEQERNRLNKWFDASGQAGEMALAKKNEGKELKKWEQSTLDVYLKKQKELDDAKATIARLRSPAPAGGTTNTIGRFKVISR